MPAEISLLHFLALSLNILADRLVQTLQLASVPKSTRANPLAVKSSRRTRPSTFPAWTG